MPRRSIQNRLPFNSPEVGAPTTIIAHGNRRLTRSAAKVLRETNNNRLSLTPQIKTETQTKGTMSECNNEQQSADSSQANAGILRSAQKGSTPMSEVSTPPRKQVLFADEVSVDKDKENCVSARLATPFRPQPQIILYNPVTDQEEEEDKEDEEERSCFEYDDSCHDDESSPPCIDPPATIPLLMLTSEVHDTTKDDDTDSLQVVGPADATEDAYDQNWDTLDSLSVMEDDHAVSEDIDCETLPNNSREDNHNKDDQIPLLAADAAVEAEHFIETNHAQQIQVPVPFEEGQNEDELEIKRASWQVYTIGFALVLFTAPFLLAADPVSMPFNVSYGHDVWENSPQAIWTTPKHGFEEPSFSKSLAKDVYMEDVTTWTTTTTIVSQTIHISTTQTMTVPIRDDSVRSTVSVGSQHPTTDLEDRYLLLVEKLKTRMDYDIQPDDRSAKPQNLVRRTWEKIQHLMF